MGASPEPEPDDTGLMAALQAGDTRAFNELMRRWERPLKGFLLRFGLTHGEAEDVAQESFVRLYQRCHDFTPGAAFKPWFLTLAGNLARNRRRWWRRRPSESLDAQAPAHQPADAAATPAEAATRAATAEAVRAAIAQLPEPMRQVIACVDLEGLSHAEAAALLGTSPKAIESRLARAREKLRTQLGAHL